MYAKVSLAGGIVRIEKTAIQPGGVPSNQIEASSYNGFHLMNAVVVCDSDCAVELRRPAPRHPLRFETFPCDSVPNLRCRCKRQPREAQKRPSFEFHPRCFRIGESADL